MQKVSNFKQFLISLLFHFKYFLITLHNISINESPYAFDLGHSKSLKMKKYNNKIMNFLLLILQAKKVFFFCHLYF